MDGFGGAMPMRFCDPDGRLIDVFQQPGGRLLLGAGNAIHADCPLTSLEAFLDEAYEYGTDVVRRRSMRE